MSLGAGPSRHAAADEDLSAAEAADLFGSATTATEDRTRATRRLAALGENAVAAVVTRLGEDAPVSGWTKCLAALREIGAAKSLATIECNRSRWDLWGLERAAPSSSGAANAGEYLAAQLAAALPATAWKSAPLKAELLEDPFRVPPSVEGRVRQVLPPELAWADVAVREKGAVLEVDLARDGRFSTKLTGPKVLVVKSGSSVRRILVYRRADRWFACSPVVLRGGSGGRAAEFLDADQNGEFDGPTDLVRFGDGGFRPVREGPLGFDGERLFRFRLRREGDALSLETTDEPEPSWLTPPRAEAMRAVHRWRHANGLALQRIDRTRTEGCDLHCAYLDRHATGSLRDHDEDPAKDGATKLGAAAGQNSSISSQPTAAGLVEAIAPTILHRRTLLGRRTDGIGVGASTTHSAQWGGPPDASERGEPILFPGAGAVGVPVAIAPEVPDSDTQANFYDTPRGFPVYVAWGGLTNPGAPESPQIRLVETAGGKPVRGFQFDAEKPYNTRYAREAGNLWFVAERPLAPGTQYTVQVTGTRDGESFELSWWFRTK